MALIYTKNKAKKTSKHQKSQRDLMAPATGQPELGKVKREKSALDKKTKARAEEEVQEELARLKLHFSQNKKTALLDEDKDPVTSKQSSMPSRDMRVTHKPPRISQPPPRIT